jgi:predicted O-linked N-acetylglucosamine transferase (SPINDLY family)
MSTELQALHTTVQNHIQSGQTQQATQVLQRILLMYPREPKAPFMLGAMAFQSKNYESALEWIGKSLAIDPTPAEPYFLRGLIYQQAGQLPQAIIEYRQCLTRRPKDGKAMNNLGRAILDLGDSSAAIQTLRQAIAVMPENAGAWNNLGEALRLSGDIAGAVQHYKQAIAVDPNSAEAYGNLGATMVQLGDRPGGIAMMLKAVAINPNMFNVHTNLARAYITGGPLEQALRHCRRALEINNRSSGAIDLMANLMGLAGLVPQCIKARQQALQLKPDDSAIFSNLLLSLHYLDDFAPRSIFDEHRNWAKRHAPGMTPPQPNDPPYTPARRLRIGYLSPNLSAHSVAYFFEPLLAAHDRSLLEIYLYHNGRTNDEVTERIKQHADGWRDISNMKDGPALSVLKNDHLDILIDLAGHTSDNRLPMMDKRPAPIQMTWLGYPGTTGMSAVDYRITDEITDPHGPADTVHTERLIRIPGGSWVYQAPVSPEIGPVPAMANGYITFGSFNNLPKVTPRVLESWARILQAVPRSRLILKAGGLGLSIGKEYVQNTLNQFGITTDRVELLGWAQETSAHFQLYNRIDIALDTFPYNGTTTTCEAMWMGVPVVTYTGSSHVSRVGTALLTHVGCKQWIARDAGAYETLAVQLAGDLPALAAARKTLRQQMQASELCDAKRLARELEKFYVEAAKSFYR